MWINKFIFKRNDKKNKKHLMSEIHIPSIYTVVILIPCNADDVKTFLSLLFVDFTFIILMYFNSRLFWVKIVSSDDKYDFRCFLSLYVLLLRRINKSVNWNTRAYFEGEEKIYLQNSWKSSVYQYFPCFIIYTNLWNNSLQRILVL